MAFHMLQNKSHEVEQELQNYQTRSELILDCRNTNRGMRNSHMPIVAALIVLLLRPSLRLITLFIFLGLPLFLVLYRPWRYPFASRVHQSEFIASVVFQGCLVVYLSVASRAYRSQT